jgi:hypothetical protein
LGISFHRCCPPPATQTLPGFCTLNPQNFSMLLSCAPVTGTLVATGADPCWGSAGIAIYRSNVTTKVPGNGTYTLYLSSSQSATNSGADPWVSNSFPAAEGASLVVVGTGTHKVAIFDSGFAGTTFLGTLSYSLTLAGGVTTQPVLWDNIGADGQIGGGRNATIPGEQTLINAVQIAGPPSNPLTDSDWDGSAGFPLPQLWDDTGHDISAAAPTATTTLNVQFKSFGDCLTPVANVVAY